MKIYSTSLRLTLFGLSLPLIGCREIGYSNTVFYGPIKSLKANYMKTGFVHLCNVNSKLQFLNELLVKQQRGLCFIPSQTCNQGHNPSGHRWQQRAITLEMEDCQGEITENTKHISNHDASAYSETVVELDRLEDSGIGEESQNAELLSTKLENSKMLSSSIDTTSTETKTKGTPVDNATEEITRSKGTTTETSLRTEELMETSLLGSESDNTESSEKESTELPSTSLGSVQSKEKKSSVLPSSLLPAVTDHVKDNTLSAEGNLCDEGRAKDEHKLASKKRKRKKKKKTVEKDAKDEQEGETTEKKKPSFPTHFVSVQISNPEVLKALSEVQEAILDKERLLEKAAVSIATSHLTLMVVRLETDEDIHKAGQSLERCLLDRWTNYVNGSDQVKLDLAGLGHFDHQVLFAEVTDGAHLDTLYKIAESVEECLLEDNIKKADPKPFCPHLTLMKFTRNRAAELRRKGIKKIKSDLYEEFLERDFGSDIVKSIQLCSMQKPKNKDTGYYHIEHEIHFGPVKETPDLDKQQEKDEERLMSEESVSIEGNSETVVETEVKADLEVK